MFPSIRWRPFPNRRCRWPILSVSARILHCGWAYALLVIAAIVVPYWWGRAIAVNDTQWLLDNLSALEPRGAAFVAWTVTLIAVSGLGLLVVDAHRRLWGAVFVIGLAAEQLIAGLCILKIDF